MLYSGVQPSSLSAFSIETKEFLLGNVNVKISRDKKSLECEAVGDKAKNYEIQTHIKAVTYNEMFVKKICQEIRLLTRGS